MKKLKLILIISLALLLVIFLVSCAPSKEELDKATYQTYKIRIKFRNGHTDTLNFITYDISNLYLNDDGVLRNSCCDNIATDVLYYEVLN